MPRASSHGAALPQPSTPGVGAGFGLRHVPQSAVPYLAQLVHAAVSFKHAGTQHKLWTRWRHSFKTPQTDLCNLTGCCLLQIDAMSGKLAMHDLDWASVSKEEGPSMRRSRLRGRDAPELLQKGVCVLSRHSLKRETLAEKEKTQASVFQGVPQLHVAESAQGDLSFVGGVSFEGTSSVDCASIKDQGRHRRTRPAAV